MESAFFRKKMHGAEKEQKKVEKCREKSQEIVDKAMAIKSSFFIINS